MSNRPLVTNKYKYLDRKNDYTDNMYDESIKIMYKEAHNIKEHEPIGEDKLEDYKQYKDKVMGKIAPFDNKGFKNVLTYSNNSNVIKGSAYNLFDKPVPYGAPNNYAEKYSNMLLPFFKELHENVNSSTGKHSTGTALMERTIGLQNLNYTFTTSRSTASYSSLKKSYENLKQSVAKNGNGFFSYDLETFGGRNVNGYGSVEAITEFAFEKYNKDASGKLINIADQSYSNVIGLTANEYDSYLKEINEMELSGAKSNRMSVIGGRAAKYGYSTTEKTKVVDAATKAMKYEVTGLPGDDAKDVFTFDNMRKGLKFLRDIGIDQEKPEFQYEGMKLHEWQLQKVFSMVNEGKTPILGHNINRADNPWMMQMAAGKFKHLTPRGTGKLNFNKDMTFDTYAALDMWSGIYGGSNLYPNKDVLKGHTPLQLEALNTLYPERKGANHTGAYDASVTSDLAFADLNGAGSLMDKVFKEIDSSTHYNNSMELLPGKQMFLAREGFNFNNYDSSAALSYTYDPSSKAYKTFNGYTIDAATGNVVKNNKVYPIGLKKNRLYTLDSVVQGDMSDEWVKMMGGSEATSLMPEFASKSMVYAKFSNVYNQEMTKGMHTEMDASYVLAFKTQEAFESYMSTMLHTASRADENSPWIMSKDKELHEMIKPVTIQDGIKNAVDIGRDIDLKYLTDYSTMHAMNDPAARKVRQGKFSHSLKFLELYDQVKDFAKKDKVSIEDVKDYVIGKYPGSQVNAKDLKLAELISKNQALTLTLQDVLGSEFNGTKSLYTETINNIFSSFDHMAEEEPIIRSVKDFMKSQGLLGKDSIKSSEEQDMIYRHLYGQVKDNIGENLLNRVTGSSKDKASILNNLTEQPYILNADADYYEFALSDKFFKNFNTVDNEMFGRAEKTMRLNFGRNQQYSLLQNLYKNKYGSGSATTKKDGVQGQSLVVNFMNALSQDKEYADMFKTAGLMENGKYTGKFGHDDPESLSTEVYNVLKAHKETHGNRYINDLSIHDVVNSNRRAAAAKSMGYFDNNNAVVNEVLKRSYENMPDFTVLSKDQNKTEQTVLKLMKDLLAPVEKLDKRELMTHGYSDKEAEAVMRNYSSARTAYKGWLEKFVSGAGKAGLDMMYDKKRGTFDVFEHGEGKSLDSLTKLVYEDGMAYFQSGNQRTALYGILDLKIGEKGFHADSIQMSTTIEKAIQHSFNPYHSFEHHANNGNALNGAVSAIQNLVKELTTFSTADHLNLSEMQNSMNFDVSTIITHLPQLHKAGFFDNINIKDKDVFDKVLADHLLKNKDKVLNGYKGASESITQMIGKNLIPINHKLAGMITSDSDAHFFLKNATPLTNETKLAEGIMTIGTSSTHANAMFNNPKRPPITQGAKMVQYNAEDWADKIQDLRSSQIKLDPIVHNAKTSAQYNKQFADGTKAVAGIRSNYMSMSENAYKELIESEYKAGFKVKDEVTGKMRNMEAHEAAQIFDTLISANLFEQGGIVNTRIASQLWHSVDEQSIKAKRNLLIDHQNNLATLAQVKKYNKILPSLDIANGKVSFNYGSFEMMHKGESLLDLAGDYGEYVANKEAKYDGLFRFKFYTKGNHVEVTQEQVQKTAQKLLSSKKFQDHTEIMTELNNIYDGSFHLSRIEESNYIKTMLGGAEKMMNYGPTIRMGSIDSKIAKAVSSSKELKGYLHKNVSDDFLYNVLSHDENIIKSFGTRQAFIDAVHTEKYKAWDYLSKNIIKNSSVNFINNLGLKKHASIGVAIESTLGLIEQAMKRRGYHPDDFTKFLGSVSSMGTAHNGMLTIPNELKGAVDYYDLDGIKKKAKSLGLLFNMNDENGDPIEFIGKAFKNKDGEIIGTIQNGFFHQTTDWSGHTSAYDYDDSMADIKRDLDNKLRSNKISQEGYDEGIRVMRQRAANEKKLQKGLKITDRGLLILDQEVYSKENITKLNKAYGADFATSRMGSSITNTSILGNVTTHMRERVLSGTGRESVIDRFREDNTANAHLAKYAQRMERTGKFMSAEQAEKMHSLVAGENAVAYNAKSNVVDAGYLEKHSLFRNEPVALKNLGFSIGDTAEEALLHPNNIYNNSMLVDLGHDVGLEGRDRFLAVSRMPVRISNGKMITYSSQDALKKVAYAREQLDKFDRGEEVSFTDRAIGVKKLLEHVDSFKEAQRLDVTSKTGILKDAMTARLAHTYTGETSTMSIYHPQGIPEGSALTKAILESDVNKPFTKMMFNGKSLLEHYTQGHAIDAAGASMEAFEAMHIFDNKILNANINHDHISKYTNAIVESGHVKVNGKVVAGSELMNVKRQAMEGLLEHEGLPGLIVRNPETRSGSDVAVQAYLNRKLVGNQMQVMSWTQRAAGGDNDSDKQQMGFFIDEMTHKIQFRKELETSNALRAITHNQYYANEIRKEQAGERVKALHNGNLLSISRNNVLDGKVYAELGITDDFDALHKSLANVADIDLKARKHIEQQIANGHIKGTFEENKSKFHEKAFNIIENEYGNDGGLKSDFILSEAFRLHEAMIVSKNKKPVIGFINTPLFKGKKMADIIFGSNPEFATNRRIMTEVSDVIEQQVINAKNELDNDTTRTTAFINSLNKVMFGNEKERVSEGAILKDLLVNHMSSALVNKHQDIGMTDPKIAEATKGMDKSQIANYMATEYVDVLSSMNNGQSSRLRTLFNKGESVMGISADQIMQNRLAIAGDNTLASSVAREAYATEGEEMTSISADMLTRKSKVLQNYAMVDGSEGTKYAGTARQEMGQVLQYSREILGRAASQLGGENLAMGALGLAGAIMVAGFVGGNPSSPAQNQAQDNAENQFYTVPSLQDGGDQQQQSGRQGYVINVNARSNKGQKHLEQALHQAMTQSSSTDVNIALNINNKSGNIDNRTIENLMARVI